MSNMGYNDTRGPYKMSYTATATANVVVKNQPGFLHAIIIGQWVTGGTIEVSDHASDGDGNVVIFLQAGTTDASGFPKTIIVDAEFETGICADIGGSQTKVTFVYK
jgi:hypothetical protein